MPDTCQIQPSCFQANIKQKKPYSAITVQVDNLTSDRYQVEDLSGIPVLIEVIELQATGPTEVARALRKKLKYGSVHAQLRALVLLNGLVENAGPKIQKQLFDEPLLERLRACGQSDLYDKRVKAKCALYCAAWRHTFKDTDGMRDVANLYKMLPRRKKDVTIENSKILKEQNERDPFEDDVDDDTSPSTLQKPEAGGSQTSPPVAGSSKHHKSKGSIIGSSFFGSSQTVPSKDKGSKSKKGVRVFDEAKEKETMKRKIADSHLESAAMMDILRRTNRSEQRISENAEAKAQLEKVKRLRQYMRRYITGVEKDDFLGPLLAAHDALMNAVVTFEQLDRSIDADSDSDDELAEQQHAYRSM